MKLRKQTRGFTVIEVIVVLAMSAGILMIGFLAFNGQSQRTEARLAIREFENKLQDISNDVNNGYYQKSNISCTEDAQHDGPPSIAYSGGTQGSSTGCIFLGKAIRLNRNSIDVFSIAGNRLNASNNNVTSIDEAFPVLISGVFESYALKYRIAIESSSYYNSNIYSGGYIFGNRPTTPKCNSRLIDNHLSGFIILYTLNSVPAADAPMTESSKGSITTNIIPICRLSNIPDTDFESNVIESLNPLFIKNNTSIGICLNNAYNSERAAIKIENNDIYLNHGDTNC